MPLKETIEKHPVRVTIATIVICAIFIITLTFRWTSEFKEVKYDVSNLQETQIQVIDRIDKMEKWSNGIDVQYGKIETRLISIEALLAEVRNDLKKR